MIILQQDSVLCPGKQQLCYYQKPKSQQSFSDVKPPTLNSSFLQSGYPSPDFVRLLPHQGGHNQSSSNIYEPITNKRFDDTETKGMKKSQFHQTRQLEQQLEPLTTEQINKKAIHKFIANLMQSAYVYKDSIFSSMQRKILMEKYLEVENQSPKTDTFYIIFYFVWEAIITFIIEGLLIWLPLQIGFQLWTFSTLSGIIITIIIIDILISTYQSIILQKCSTCVKTVNHIYFSAIEITDILYLISYAIIQFSVIDSAFTFIGLVIQFICGFLKLQAKLDRWLDYFPYDMNFILFISKTIMMIHYCACIWNYIGVQETESWITQMGISQSDNFTRYCYSLYWSTTSLLSIGQGNIQIVTNMELLYSTFIMFLSCWILSYILLYVSNMLKDVHEEEYHIRKQLKLINQFFQNRKISFLMKSKVRNQIRHQYRKGNDSNLVINTYTYSQTGLGSNFLASTINKKGTVPLDESRSSRKMQNFSKIFTYNSAKLNFNHGVFIKQIDSSLYIIETGQVEQKEYGKVVQNLKSGDSFGQYSFFSGSESQSEFKTVLSTQLYKIQQVEFVKLIQQQKLDYERFMFMKHSLQNGNYEVVNMRCYSCNSAGHLITNCPLINYKPNVSRLLKESNSGYQERSDYARSGLQNFRLNNQIFKKMALNYDSLKLLRIKYEIESYDDSSEEEESEDTDSVTNQDYSSDQIFSNNKIIDKQDGTVVSILKSHDQVIENAKIPSGLDNGGEEIFIIRPTSQQATISTAQFQLDQQQLLQQQQQQQLQQQQYRFSLMPVEHTIIKRSSQSQLDQLSQQYIASEGPIPSVKRIKHTSQMYDKPRSGSSVQSPISGDKGRRNLSKIREEDPDTLSLTNKISDDQFSTPFAKYPKHSYNSIPSKNTFIGQSAKRIPSKLSSIHPSKSGTTINFKTHAGGFTRTNLHFPSQYGLVDLSMYKGSDTQEEFEIMYIYTIYFPLWNFTTVIKRLNKRIRQTIQQLIQTSRQTPLSEVEQQQF